MVIKVVSISDIHQGIQRLEPDRITNNLRSFLFPILSKPVDIIFFAGDFFDNLLSMDSVAGYEAAMFINDLIHLAEEKHFLIRVLQGTFSHDRNQNQFFKTIKQNVVNSGGEELIKIVSQIDIEFISSLGINVLYVPDDLPFDNVEEVILTRLRKSGLKKVDVMVHHGYFSHLIPSGMPHTPKNTLDANRVEAFVKGMVLNGHVHTPSVYKKIINNGSFDRLAHGEEEAKGFFYITYDTETEKVVYDFIENKNACVFKTIDLRSYDKDDSALQILVDYINELSKNTDTAYLSFINVITESQALRQSIREYVKAYPFIRLDFKKNKSSYEGESLNELQPIKDLPMITPSNLSERVFSWIKTRGGNIDKKYIKYKIQ